MSRAIQLDRIGLARASKGMLMAAQRTFEFHHGRGWFDRLWHEVFREYLRGCMDGQPADSWDGKTNT